MKHLIVKVNAIILIFAICIIMTGCNANKKQSDYKLGIEALEQQNYNEALNHFKASCEKGEEARLSLRGEGLAYLGLSKYDEALSSFKSALEESNGLVKSVDYDINYYMAVAEFKSGKIEDAIKTYTNIIAVNKNEADAYYLRGKSYLELGKPDEAKADYDKATELDKDNSRLYINIHDDLLAKGYESDAKSYINKGIASVSKPSTYELGIFNYYLGDYTQARNYFEESNETKKTEEGIIYLAKTYVALDDKNYAIALYEEFTENNKTADIVYNEIGLLKYENKDYEGALAAFKSGLENENAVSKQSLLYNVVVTYEMMGDFSEAKKQMELYLEQFPGDEKAKREYVFLSTR